ncbi:MAG: AI-2E family transporter [Armatimonadetes bacterium]|nr:AI-2E family transporter [Armatimonadota bacterium]
MARRAWWFYIPHLVLALAGLWLVYRLRSALAPFFIAYILAALLDPQVRRMEARGWRRGRAVAAIFGIFLLVFLSILFTVVPVAVGEIRQISRQISTYVGDVQMRAGQAERARDILGMPPREPLPGVGTGGGLPGRTPTPEAPAETPAGPLLLAKLQEIIHRFQVPLYLQDLVARHAGDVYAALARRVGAWVQAALGSAGFLLWLVIIPVATFYLLNDIQRVRGRLLLLVPEKHRTAAQAIAQDVAEVFLSYLRGLTLVSALYGLAMLLALVLIGVPYAVALALLAGALYPVPILGPLITVVTIFIVASLGMGWGVGALGGGVALAANQVFDQLVTPRIVGKSVGLHPVLSMIALLAGADLLGLLGMVLAVPVAGAIQVVVLRLLPWLRSEGAPAPAAEEIPKRIRPPRPGRH